MARHLRMEYPGAIYHVTSRGNERSDIFRNDRDAERFREKLGGGASRYHVRLYAYVVMTNHYHLLVETPRANLAAFMQQLNTSYTMYYNVRHDRVGHVFSGRYKAKVVAGDAYLLALSRYVHLNPVKIARVRDLPKAERVHRLRAYEWSSYRDYAGMRKAPDWLAIGPVTTIIKERFGGVSYQAYVESGLAEEDEDLKEILAQSSKAVGDGKFRRWVEREYRQARRKGGADVDVSMRRVETGPEAKEVVGRVCETLGVEPERLRKRRSVEDARLIAVKLLKDVTGLTQRGIGAVLGLKDGSGVGNLLGVADRRLSANRGMRKTYARLKKALLA